MSGDFDVIIVGSGPAGVSVAFPLVKAGLKVLMVDGGQTASLTPPSQAYLTERYDDDEQWRWMLGKDFYALRQMNAVSPKLRVPMYQYVFDKFIDNNRLKAKNFIAVGSLAKGGLSNAWGCGVARLKGEELNDYPFPESEISKSYENIIKRIGVSGACDDDLSEYFGVDEWSQPPIPMDELHHSMLARYSSHNHKLNSLGFHLGRSRVAALTRDLGGRQACDILGNCLWGCSRGSLYSSVTDLSDLMQSENFYYQSGFVVKRVTKNSNHLSVEGKKRGAYSAKKIILAAGTLATTKLVLHALKISSSVKLQSCPTAAFLMWVPRKLGAPIKNSFGLGQLSYSLRLTDEISAFGSTFSTTGIPASEFVRHIPFQARHGVDLWRQLLSSCVVGNMFLPGHLSTSSVRLGSNGGLNITGAYNDKVDALMSESISRLRKSYWKLGALLLPKSFIQGLPGGDIHYSSTLPMHNKPVLGQTDAVGELVGLPGVHVVDGACLTRLTEKSHTLTIMANADRIGRNLAVTMKGVEE